MTRSNALQLTAIAQAGGANYFPSRWRPLDLRCNDDESHETFVVRAKPVCCEDSAAVGFAEEASSVLMRTLGAEVAQSAVVTIDDNLATALSSELGYPTPIRPGRHWGTVLLDDAVAITTESLKVAELQDPVHLLRIYLGDVVLGNVDRTTEGNLLARSAKRSKYELIAIDHSESFFHPSCLRDPSCLDSKRTRDGVSHYPQLDQVMDAIKEDGLRDEFESVKNDTSSLTACISNAADFVPDEWLLGPGIDVDAVCEYTQYRAENVFELARFSHWEGICRTLSGGSQGLGI